MTQTNGARETEVGSPFDGLRVCHVGPHLPRKGGVTIQTHLTEDGLRRSGAQVYSIDTILHFLSHPLLLPLRVLLQPVVTAFRFLGAARKCDVIHLQACSWWGFLPVLVCAPLNKWFTGKRAVASYHGARGHIFLDKYHAIVAPYMRMLSAIGVVSPELQQAFARYGIETEVMDIIINLDAFHFRERLEIKPNIVWVRQFEEMYDPFAAVTVFESVKKEFPEATITLIGSGSMRSSVERMVVESGLAGVRFTGILPNTKLPDEFDKADIFLNTSKNDAKPAALLEAAAAGLPIVTTAAGGIPDMVTNGEDAVIVPVGDAEALAREIIALIRDPERARRIGIAARKNAERYGWDSYSNELARLYGLRGTDKQV